MNVRRQGAFLDLPLSDVSLTRSSCVRWRKNPVSLSMGKLACGFNARKEITKLGKNQGLSVHQAAVKA